MRRFIENVLRVWKTNGRQKDYKKKKKAKRENEYTTKVSSSKVY